MSKLTRENYERFVSILANHNASDELAKAVSDYFKEDNDKFNADKFIKEFLSQVEVHRKLHKVHNKLKQYKIMWAKQIIVHSILKGRDNE